MRSIQIDSKLGPKGGKLEGKRVSGSLGGGSIRTSSLRGASILGAVIGEERKEGGTISKKETEGRENQSRLFKGKGGLRVEKDQFREKQGRNKEKQKKRYLERSGESLRGGLRS